MLCSAAPAAPPAPPQAPPHHAPPHHAPPHHVPPPFPFTPQTWRAPGPVERPLPYLFNQGWPIAAGVELPQLIAEVCAALGAPPSALFGSRVGELAALRAALLAVASDVLLEPESSVAWAFQLTPRGARKATERGRALLLGVSDVRAQLSALLEPVLGLRLPL